MKIAVFFFVFVFCYAECRKTYAPIDKNANLAFINMEAGGGGVKSGANAKPAAPAAAPSSPTKPQAPTQTPAAKPLPAVVTSPTPKPAPTPAPAQKPISAPIPTPTHKSGPPTQIKPVPVNPAPVANPITTPGPGSVKQLINFYDSQGKASPIRPYSYSQAVKQG